MESIDPVISILSSAIRKRGGSPMMPEGSDGSIGDLMRVADEPLLLHAFMVQQGKGMLTGLPPLRLPVRIGYQGDGPLMGDQTAGYAHRYAEVEPLQAVSLRPEVFVPREEDVSEALSVTGKPTGDRSFLGRCGLATILAGTGLAVLVLLGACT